MYSGFGDKHINGHGKYINSILVLIWAGNLVFIHVQTFSLSWKYTNIDNKEYA